MKRLRPIIMCIVLSKYVSGQTMPYEYVDTVRHPSMRVERKYYKKYRKETCDFKMLSESKGAKNLLCKASYFYSIKEFYASMECLKQVYTKACSTEFKFQILKLMADNYKQLGDTLQGLYYEKKAKNIWIEYPKDEK